MNLKLLILIILVFLGFAVVFFSFSLLKKPNEKLTPPQITINNAALTLEIADTPEKQTKGLGGHNPLSGNEGMLFPYSPALKVVFWMKDMTFPIDIIYIADSKVVQIYPNIPPPLPNAPIKQLKRYPSSQPVDYVLETQAGWTKKHGIVVGNNVNLSL